MAVAIKESGVERSDIFLTTKLWPKDYGIGTTREAALASLKRLDTDYLDLVKTRCHITCVFYIGFRFTNTYLD